MVGYEALPVPSPQAFLALRHPEHVEAPDLLLTPRPVLEEAVRPVELAPLSLVFAYCTLAHDVVLQDLPYLLDGPLAFVQVGQLLEGEVGIPQEKVDVVLEKCCAWMAAAFAHFAAGGVA